MASGMAFLALPKLSPITDNIGIILTILSIIAIKTCTENGNPKGDKFELSKICSYSQNLLVGIKITHNIGSFVVS